MWGSLRKQICIQIRVQQLTDGMTTLSLSSILKIKEDISNSPVNVCVYYYYLTQPEKSNEVVGNPVEIVLH